MDEIDAMKAVGNALEPLDLSARGRVLAWAHAKFGNGVPQVALPAPNALGAGAATGSVKSKTSKKSKTVISMDKTLNLAPQGKPSAAAFAEEKKPSNVVQKSVVAAYYLRDVVGVKVTPQGVFTFFKFVQWPAPTDMKNTLQQAGSAGWLDTADSEDIKITSSGENLVEHNMPSKKAA
jgi:hypothetical protein